jgi:hypothetical protein
LRHSSVAPAVAGRRITEVLPRLHNIFLEELEPSGPVREVLQQSIPMRQLTRSLVILSPFLSGTENRSKVYLPLQFLFALILPSRAPKQTLTSAYFFLFFRRLPPTPHVLIYCYCFSNPIPNLPNANSVDLHVYTAPPRLYNTFVITCPTNHRLTPPAPRSYRGPVSRHRRLRSCAAARRSDPPVLLTPSPTCRLPVALGKVSASSPTTRGYFLSYQPTTI